MAKKRKNLIWKILSGIVVLALVVALPASIPPASKQLPPNSAPMLSVIDFPTDGSRWPADTPIPVSLMVTGTAAIQNVELWIDGTLFDTQSAGDDYFYHVWHWMPLTEGEHTLFARATDTNHQRAESNVVHIQAEAASGFLAVVTAQEGDTLPSLAAQNNVPLDQVAASNPTLDPQAPLPVGRQVFIPVSYFPELSPVTSPTPAPIVGPVSPASPGGPAAVTFWGEGVLHLSSLLPEAPGLSASTGVCNVTLTIQDNSTGEDGFYVYSLANSAVSFKRLASLKAHLGTGNLQYMVPDQHGQVQFYVSAFDALGESPSDPVSVNITRPECDPNQGNLKYSGGFLILPDGTSLAYMYASVNGGTWQRLPSDHQFLEPMAGQVDLRPKIQQLLGGAVSGEVDLDVWGWSDGALVHLGKLHLTINFASLAICNLSAGCGGDMASTHWVTDATVGSDQQSTSRSFRWSAQGIDITYGIWQIGSLPFPVEYSVGAPPGLIASGISDAAVDQNSGMAAGTFDIDFASDLKTAASQTYKRSIFHFPGQGGSAFDHFLFTDLASQWNNALNPSFMPAWLPEILYVRVMPMAGGHPASDPSNTVTVSYQRTGPAPTIHISKVPTYKVEIVPDSYTNDVKMSNMLGTKGCSIINGVDHDTYTTWYEQEYQSNYYEQYCYGQDCFDQAALDNAAGASYQSWTKVIGWKACPASKAEKESSTIEDIFNQLGDLFETVWNGLVSAFNAIKGTLVNILADVIPGCGNTCKAVLEIGLNIAITYFTGLPPSLPSYQDLINDGIDYAVQTAINESGVPYCDQDCQNLIADKIKGIADEMGQSGGAQPACFSSNNWVQKYATDGTTNYELQPLCFPPGILTTPVKGSIYQPATLQVRVSRTDGSPQSVPTEQLAVDVHAVNTAYGNGQVLTGELQGAAVAECTNKPTSDWTGVYGFKATEPLEGTAFPEALLSIPPLKAGQSIILPVIFEDPTYWAYYEPYPPRLKEIQKYCPTVDMKWVAIEWELDGFHLTDSGSQITIQAQVHCQDPSTPWFFDSSCSNTDEQQFIAP
jgi:LysM repeat protein